MSHHLAIDLGAGSGRAILGSVSQDRLSIEELHRFTYAPRETAGHLRWDSPALFDGIRAGLSAALARLESHGMTLDSVGVDSWGVDYGLLDETGRLVEEPICYRDSRTQRMVASVTDIISREELFDRTGTQLMALNTLFQLCAHVQAGLSPGVHRLLLTPDLCHHFLCGAKVSEYTIASTTQMLHQASRDWDRELLARLQLPTALLAPIVQPGTALGRVFERLLPPGIRKPPLVIAPAAHDTASAVAGTPLQHGWAYISSGTWSLVGLELPEPLVNPDVARAGFTNEGGVAGTIRLLSNVMGLWLLQSCLREWRDRSLQPLLDAVAARGGPRELVCPDAQRFFNPSSMTSELLTALREQGHRLNEDPVVLTKVILDSLALRYASVLESVERLTGRRIEGIHIVGGGCQNEYLNQATANATGRPVLAGPVEATATGNILVQSIAHGTLASLDEGRDLVSQAWKPRRFEPRDHAVWFEAAGRYREIEARALAAATC